MRRISFALALLAVMGFGSLFIESASAQNSNSSNTMSGNMKSTMGHRRRRHRRHRRHKMKHAMKMMAPKNANQ